MDLGLTQIRELIELVNQSTLSELTLETGEIKLFLRKHGNYSANPSGSAQVAQLPSNEAGYSAENARSIQIAPPFTDDRVGAHSISGEGGLFRPESRPDQNLYQLRSPMVGTFYRASAPDSAPFAEVGQVVQPGDTVCIIEAMKLMNEIEAENGGRVARICVGNGEPVEFGQLLLEIEH